MYIDSTPGQMGFAERQMTGGDAATSYVTMMGTEMPGPAQGQPPVQPQQQMVMAPSAAMVSVDEAHQRNVAIGITIALALGVGFVIYKATRD